MQHLLAVTMAVVGWLATMTVGMALLLLIVLANDIPTEAAGFIAIGWGIPVGAAATLVSIAIYEQIAD